MVALLTWSGAGQTEVREFSTIVICSAHSPHLLQTLIIDGYAKITVFSTVVGPYPG